MSAENTSSETLKAVVAMDVVQLFIYLGGAAASMALILHRLPHGWADVTAFATAGDIAALVGLPIGLAAVSDHPAPSRDALDNWYTVAQQRLVGDTIARLSGGRERAGCCHRAGRSARRSGRRLPAC